MAPQIPLVVPNIGSTILTSRGMSALRFRSERVMSGDGNGYCCTERRKHAGCYGKRTCRRTQRSATLGCRRKCSRMKKWWGAKAVGIASCATREQRNRIYIARSTRQQLRVTKSTSRRKESQARRKPPMNVPRVASKPRHLDGKRRHLTCRTCCHSISARTWSGCRNVPSLRGAPRRRVQRAHMCSVCDAMQEKALTRWSCIVRGLIYQLGWMPRLLSALYSGCGV